MQTAIAEPWRSSRLTALSWGGRLAALLVVAVAMTPLVIASRLTPAAEGHGTHEQLGLYSCAWPVAFDVPCPACGMTTAFAHAAEGNLIGAFRAQPFAAALAVGCAAAVCIGVYIAATGSRVGREFSGLLRPKAMWTMVLLAAAAWGYKVLTWESLR